MDNRKILKVTSINIKEEKIELSIMVMTTATMGTMKQYRMNIPPEFTKEKILEMWEGEIPERRLILQWLSINTEFILEPCDQIPDILSTYIEQKFMSQLKNEQELHLLYGKGN